MEIINLTSNAVQNIASNSEIIGQGSNGILYNIDNEILFKFNYKKFIDCFSLDGNSVNIRKLNDITETVQKWKEVDFILNGEADSLYVKNLKSLIDKQKNIQMTHLPKGLVYVDGFCVGTIIQYHKDYVNLFEHLKNNDLSEECVSLVSKNLSLATEELIKNNVYHRDFTLRNVMYNPNTNDVQIIDFEDAVSSLSEQDKGYEQSVRDRLKINIDTLKSSLQKENEEKGMF
jgi:serine/threonine protein kinase